MTTIATISPKRRWWRRPLRIAKSIAFIYLMVVLMFSLFQRRLIFIGMHTQNAAEAQIPNPPEFSQLLHLRTANGDSIAVLFGPALTREDHPDPAAATRPTLLYFYGNAMCMADALEQFHDFRSLGLNVMVVEYTGYGLSSGEASEQGCYDAAETAYQHLLTRTDIDPHKIIACGWSLGGAVAIHLAAAHAGEDHICALVTFCAFTRLADVAAKHYPFLPANWILKYRFESLAKIGAVHVPIFIGHGRQDSIIPFEMSGRLTGAAKAPVTRFICDHADHNDFFDESGADLTIALQKFLAPFIAADGNTAPSTRSDSPHSLESASLPGSRPY